MTPFQKHVKTFGSCTACFLHETRTHIVLARGKVPCQLLFIGEAPGQSEDTLGAPFVGPAGHLLDEIIRMAVGNRKVSIAFTNLIACIPLSPDDLSKTEEPPPESIKACRNRLDDFVGICRPKIIVRVGRLSSQYAPETGVHIIDVLHPAAILRIDTVSRPIAIKRCTVAISDAISLYID